jgi:hypothetical protein
MEASYVDTILIEDNGVSIMEENFVEFSKKLKDEDDWNTINKSNLVSLCNKGIPQNKRPQMWKLLTNLETAYQIQFKEKIQVFNITEIN